MYHAFLQIGQGMYSLDMKEIIRARAAFMLQAAMKMVGLMLHSLQAGDEASVDGDLTNSLDK